MTIRGAGPDKSVLSFRGQRPVRKACVVNASSFTLENIAIGDSKGDGPKVQQAENVTIRNVRVGEPAGEPGNGAYGLYPVKTHNVLIETRWRSARRMPASTSASRATWWCRNSRAEFNVPASRSRTPSTPTSTAPPPPTTPAASWCSTPALSQRGGAVRMFRNKGGG